jgi:hypothetical protein
MIGRLLLGALIGILPHCHPTPAPARRAPIETWAFCGVNPNDPTAPKQAAVLARTAGIDATFGPCLPPDWSTYTPATPGARYMTPADYLRLVEINAAAGMRTVVYDARIWSDDPTTRSEAIEFWRPHTTWLAAFDMGDEFDTAEWPILTARWATVWNEARTELGIDPYTNNLPWMLDQATLLEGDSVSFDLYDVSESLALAEQHRDVSLTCAVNALHHNTFAPTPGSVEWTMRAHRNAGCDRLLIFGGTTPENTPGFDSPSLVTRTGQPTALARAVARGAR